MSATVTRFAATWAAAIFVSGLLLTATTSIAGIL